MQLLLQPTGKPYIDIIESDGTISRLFPTSTKPEALKWHMDDEDRNIEVLEGKGWQFQKDNELPFQLNVGDNIFIKRHQIHRVLKGTTDLKIKINV